MRIEDEDEELVGYDFPVTIHKPGGLSYQVTDLESLEYHLLQGWTIEKPEEVEEPAAPVLLTPDSLDGLREEVAALRAEVAALRSLLPNTEMVKGQGQLMAAMNGRLTTLEKANRLTKVAAIPGAPAMPPAPPVT